MAEAFQACRAASQSISAASNGGRGSQEAADACSPRRRAIRRRHSAVDEGGGGRVVARHIFKRIRVNWSSIIVTGIAGTIITMPDIAYVSIFMDNDLTHITEDHFDIKLIARLLDQIYVVQPPMFPLRYDDTPPEEYEYSQPPPEVWEG